jgi:hypothetical protein
VDFEPIHLSEPEKVGNAACPTLPESKMTPYKDFGNMELLIQDQLGKLLRSHSGQDMRELNKHDLVDSGLFKAHQLFLGTREKSKVYMRGQDFYRVGIKRQNEGRPLRLSSGLDDAPQERSMTAMMTVEVADRRDRVGPYPRMRQPTGHGQHRGQ